MSLLTTLESDLKTAMLSAQTDRVAVLRLILAGFKNERIKLKRELSDDEAVKVLGREAKQRKDSIAAYTDANRPELAAAEQAELAIIEAYLPQQLSGSELEAIIDGAIAQTGAKDMKEMGAVIGVVMKQVAGKADGGAVSALVRAKLQV